MNVIRKNDVDKLQKDITAVINPTKKIKTLEKKLQFSDSFENKVALADAYLENKMYAEAITQYQAALTNMFKNDFYVISKLQECHYFSSDFATSLEYAQRIIDTPKFKKYRSFFLYGMALEKEGQVEKAEEVLKSYNAPYSKYQERLELAKFYIRNNKLSASKEVLQEIITESENMSKPSYKQNKAIIIKAKELFTTSL
ncbi:hypothetical protein [uncultured Maribacter sp.]|uniref:hypothetical protein n=1 Tax=uncultured Maribacter sp. TaxID=431308 RepID=UPI00260A1D79|nr:hypothetical protein [uncultured Maribacter sp.]